MIYLDNAATTLHKPKQVIDAVINALETMGSCARGAHTEALASARAVYDARGKLSKLFGCERADHVVFTSNSTEALNIAISGLIGAGDHVVSTDLEHNSVLRPLYRLEAERGVELSFVPADGLGNVDYADFERLLRRNTRAIVCTHASNLTGTVLDIEKIAQVAHAHNAVVIVDASQTAGAYPIDMRRMDADVLCFTGHKGLMGPQGTGGLCIKEGVDIRPFKVGGSGVQSYQKTHPTEYPARLEAGTLNGHGIAGLGAAAGFLLQTGVDAVFQKEHALMMRFYEGVRNVEGVTVYGDFSKDKTAVAALNIWDYDSGRVSDELSERYGISTRPGAHCAPRMHQALGTVETGAVRFSFSYYNTEKEIDEAIWAVREIAR